VGHQQMMTEPIHPLGMSFFSFITDSEMARAGGRLFVNLSPELASPHGAGNYHVDTWKPRSLDK
jgi:pyruvate,water dikinase